MKGLIGIERGKTKSAGMGWRIGEAAEFLVCLLAGRELPSVEVYEQAAKAGIIKATLNRAKRIVKAKARKDNRQWYLSVPEEMKGHTFNIHKRSEKQFTLKPINPYGISSDWVCVATDNDGVIGQKIEIPARVTAGGGLRVRAGLYEI
jgi:hypothetical protein